MAIREFTRIDAKKAGEDTGAPGDRAMAARRRGASCKK
jgi:hypothetical protein